MPPLTNRTRSKGNLFGTRVLSSRESRVPTVSVRKRRLSGNNRPGPGQQSLSRQIADVAEDSKEDRELDGIRRRGARQSFPQEPQNRLGDAHRPHRAVEIPPLVSFVLRRALDA